jgi:hypothetical protein
LDDRNLLEVFHAIGRDTLAAARVDLPKLRGEPGSAAERMAQRREVTLAECQVGGTVAA